jgi:hypothetical protein
MVPDGHYIGAARWRQFGLDFAAFWAKNGKKTAKKGQNWRVLVTCQLTMCFCIAFILLGLHDFYSRKTDNKR